MPSWVVPTVAAEYWGVTLDVIWGRIYNDLVPHKADAGFVFVDVDPNEDEPLPELDEEETATFGRLSWQEVRRQVSRTRRPPQSQSHRI